MEVCNKLALLALKLSKTEQCVEILMTEGKHGSPEKQKVIWRTLASVLMPEKDLSSELAAVVSSIFIVSYKMAVYMTVHLNGSFNLFQSFYCVCCLAIPLFFIPLKVYKVKQSHAILCYMGVYLGL